MSWTFGTEAIAKKMAGENADATIVADSTTLAVYSDMAEGMIETETGKAFIDNYASLATGIKGTLNAVTCAWVANKIIDYNSTGYLSREADTILNINSDIIVKGLKSLREHNKLHLNVP